jgi:ClpP class serine protease
MKLTAFDAALNAVWAMEERSLEMLLEIAAREHDVTPEALEAYTAKSVANAQRARSRDGVAILDAIGPLFRRANLMTAISGATSYDILRQDLQTALDDPTVKAIILNIDSPGGEANGTSASLPRRCMRPAGEADHRLRRRHGRLGCLLARQRSRQGRDLAHGRAGIHRRAGCLPRGGGPAGEKTYRFVSSQSPNKNPELGTAAANEQIQATIDAMAAVFVADVARNRGVATETVLSDFGKGGIFVGQAAVDAGLADSIGTFETVLAELTGGTAKLTSKGIQMVDQTITAEQRDAAVTAAVTAENTRVAGLVRLADAHNAHAKLGAAITAKTERCRLCSCPGGRRQGCGGSRRARPRRSGRNRRGEAPRRPQDRRRGCRPGRRFDRRRAGRFERSRQARQRDHRIRQRGCWGVTTNERFQQHQRERRYRTRALTRPTS